MSVAEEVESLASQLFEARRELRNAGRALHDEAGALLSATGLRLQLLRMDYPETAQAVGEALMTLDQAMESVRALSQELNPSPAAHLGLHAALVQAISRFSESFPGMIRLSYMAAAKPPPDAAVAVYDAAIAVLEHAIRDPRASRIDVLVSGTRNIAVRVVSDGRSKWPLTEAAAEARRARPAGVILDLTTKEGTLVRIRYAARRPARR